MWYSSPVLHGRSQGNTIDFPTINLNPEILPEETKRGVYACLVRFADFKQVFQGALYYGPRLISNESKLILEIFILDFAEDVYDQKVSFELKDYIRPPADFESFEQMKKQIADDVEKVRLAL